MNKFFNCYDIIRITFISTNRIERLLLKKTSQMNTINFNNNSKATKIQLFLGSQVPKIETLCTSLKTHDTRGTDEYTSAANESDNTNAMSCINT